MTARSIPIACAALVLAACGGSSATPSQPSPSTQVRVVIHFQPSIGSYTASLQGRTLTTAGAQTFMLSPGPYEITGQMRAQGSAGALLAIIFTKSEIIGLQSSDVAGTAWNSVRSVSGPPATALPCSLVYSFDGSGNRDFRVQFTVTNSTVFGSYCP